MNIRKLITIMSIIVLLGGIVIVLYDFLTLPSGAYIDWQFLLAFSLPAFVVVLLLLINLKIKGSTYQLLLIAAILALGIFSIFEPVARITSAISLIAFIPMFLVDRQRKPNRIN